MTAAIIESLITQRVAEQYERYPYPGYPLLGKPVWQDGYMAASIFSQTLARDLHNSAVRNGDGKCSVFVAGCGEIFPYVIRSWEPRDHTVLCLDLARANLRRARFRAWRSFKRTQFRHSDLDDFLRSSRERFDHIDAYGVLHHLADPHSTIRMIAQRMAPGATLRVMMYNTIARNWLTHLRKAFQLMGLNPYKQHDLRIAERFLNHLAEKNPHLQQKLKAMIPALRHRGRFVDTFFHQREVRFDIHKWFDLFQSEGLKPIGLLDRYGELDDLPNPLWRMPTPYELTIRAEDGRFANNLELFWVKPSSSSPISALYKKPWSLVLRRPPRLWFSYDETRTIPAIERWRVWHHHIEWTHRKRRYALRMNQSNAAAQRLARIGAILPGQAPHARVRERLLAPMKRAMTPTFRHDGPVMINGFVEAYIEGILRRNHLVSVRRRSAIDARLDAALRAI